MPNFQAGPQIAGQGIDGGGGTGAALGVWNNPNNVAGQAGLAGSFAESTVEPEAISNRLQVTNFGFNIPPLSNVFGVSFAFNKRSFSLLTPLTVIDGGIFLMVNGAAVGTDHSQPITAHWPTVEGSSIYGSSNDTWGLGTSITAADVNNPAGGFGIQIAARNISGFTTFAYVYGVFCSIFYQVVVTGTGGGSGIGNVGRSIGGFIGFERILLLPSKDLNFYTFDTTSFNDPNDGATYSWRVEELVLARKPSVSRLFVTYRDLGLVTVTFTLTAVQDDQTVVTNSATAVLGNATPTGRLLTKEVDLFLSGMNMQLSMSRRAGDGPLSIAKLKMVGRIEVEDYT